MIKNKDKQKTHGGFEVGLFVFLVLALSQWIRETFVYVALYRLGEIQMILDGKVSYYLLMVIIVLCLGFLKIIRSLKNCEVIK